MLQLVNCVEIVPITVPFIVPIFILEFLRTAKMLREKASMMTPKVTVKLKTTPRHLKRPT